MAGVTVRIPAGRGVLMWGGNEFVEFGSRKASLADMVFGFLEEEEGSSPEFSGDNNGDGYVDEVGNEDEHDGNSSSVEERKAFWETQHQLLQVSFIHGDLSWILFF